LQNDKSLCTTFRNYEIKKERIINLVSDIVVDNRLRIEDQEDIRRAVEVYLTKLEDLDLHDRNSRLGGILRNLSARRGESGYFLSILREVRALEGVH